MTGAALYSAGDCSVCASAGAAIFVKRVGSEVFFASPSCGCAWRQPPTPFQVETIDPPTTFAPEGFRIASFEDISSAGLAALIRGHDTDGTTSCFAGMAGFEGSVSS